MALYQITVQKDDSWNILNNIGDIGKTHFIDINLEESPYNLPYTQQIKNCEESEKKLNYISDQCAKHYVKVKKPTSVKRWKDNITKIKQSKKKSIQLLLEEIQNDIKEHEKFV